VTGHRPDRLTPHPEEHAMIVRMPRWTISLALCAMLVAPRARAAETVKVGAILAVTGPAAFLGAPEARTLQMLVDQVNAQGGIQGRKVELVVKDSGASPEKAISFAKQLIDEEKVFAIIGPTTSGETMAIKSIAEQGNTLLLSCAAAEVIVQPVAKNVFKTPQKDSYAAVKIFQQLKKLGLTRVGVLTSNTGFGKAGKEQLEKLAPEHGIQIVVSEVYDKAATDLTAEVTKIKAANVQAIVNWSIEPAQSIVIKNARQLGLAMPIFQSHGFGNVQYAKAAGAAGEGVLFPGGKILVAEALSDSDPQKKVLVGYTRAYQAKYQEEASAFGGYAYDAFVLLKAAIEQVGLDREKVRAAIENTKGFVGTSGIFNFSPADHNGLGLDAFEMLTVKDGKFAVLAR
jgi:branched-chain amino acid transport system substrate-binding protein